MCVIMIADDKPLSKNMVKRAHHKNPDGLGVAWIDKDRCRYRKGLSLGAAFDLLEKLPRPYVLHARYATEGEVTDTLCHPFPVTTRNSQRTYGRVPRVLFHNGHWTDWKATVHRIEKRYGVELPAGPMSDSRAMAWLVAHLGHGVLDMAHGQRYVVLSSDGVQRFGLNWKKWNGYWVSNTRWTEKKKKLTLITPKSKWQVASQGTFASVASRLPQVMQDRIAATPKGVPRKKKKAAKSTPIIDAATTNGFYTVPSESGPMLVKARSADDAFKIASGHAPGWRRTFDAAGSHWTPTEDEPVQTLEDWLLEKDNLATWGNSLLPIKSD